MRNPSLTSIFLAVDSSQGADAPFAHALKLALALRVQLSILHVQPETEDVDWATFPAVRSTLVRWGVLREGAGMRDLGAVGLDVVKVTSIGTDPVRSILRYIDQHGPDLIVLATHQRQGFERWVHQAVAEPVARRSGVMTLVVPLGGRGFVSPADGRVGLTTILVPAATIPPPQPAVDAASVLARVLGCSDVRFLVLHVGAEDDAPSVRVSQEPGWTCERLVRAGDTVDEILGIAAGRSADLIAMTTQGHKGFLDALRGSTTERLLRSAPCPVLAVPAF